MKRRLSFISPVLLVLLCFPLYAQLQTGNIFGHGQTKDGSVLPGVTVTLTGVGAPQTFITDAGGAFRFLNLSPGTYSLKAELANFGTSTRQGITVNIARNADVTMTLNPSQTESITVTAEAPLLDVRKAGTGATVTKVELEKVPTGRDPWVILQQTPGVLMDRLNFRGSESGQQSSYTAKGVGGYLGRSNQINNIDDYGAEAGGPIMKDKLWLWGAYSKQQIKLFVPERVDQLCPPTPNTGCSDATSFLGNKLSANGIEDNTSLKTLNGKLNAQVLPSNSFAGAYSRGEKVKFGRNVGPTRPPETAWDQNGPTTIWKVEATQIFKPNFYLTGLYSHQNSVFNLIPDAGQRCTTLSCALNGPTTWLDINVVPHRSFIAFTTERPQTQYRGDASSFFSTGSVSHELKYGFGYRKAPVTSFSAYAGNAFGLMFDTQLVPGGSGGAYLLRPTNFTYDVKSQDAYLGDTMMIGNLTIQGGARYDNQKGSVRSGSTTANPIVPDLLPAISWNGSDLGQLKFDTISPRIGLTYALGSDRKTLLRASANRYVDQVGGFTVYGVAPATYQYLYYYFTDVNGNGFPERNEIDFNTGLQGFFGLDPKNPTHSVTRYDPNIKAPKTDELIVGFEREVLTDFSVGVNATYRKLRDFIGTRIEKTRGAGDYVTAA